MNILVQAGTIDRADESSGGYSTSRKCIANSRGLHSIPSDLRLNGQ
jgi:hypothetical protein